MALDPKKMKAMQERMKSSANGSYFLAKEITEEDTFIRILPSDFDGLLFKEVFIIWINGKKYISPKTFGLPCPVEEEVKEAKAEKDKDLNALLEDSKKFSQKVEYWMPILLVKPTFDSDGEIESIKVLEGPKVAQIGRMLALATQKVSFSKKAANGTPDGITDRLKGSIIQWSKTGSGLNTEYSAEWIEKWEMEKKHYESIPDVNALIEGELKSDDFLTAAIRNYLYGEGMPEEEKKSDKKEKPKSDSKKTKKVVEEEEEDEEEDTDEEADDDEEEEEEEEKLKSKKKSEPETTTAKKSAKVEEKKVDKKVEAKTTTSKAKTKSILEDISDLD